jgi:glyoxylase I family protein
VTAVRFSHVALACTDPQATEDFYSRHFGFRRARLLLPGPDQIVFIRSGDVYLELFRAKEPEPKPQAEADGPWNPGPRHLAFQVESVDDKLAEMGDDARVTLGPLDFDAFIPGWRTVWVSDPEGNIVEISQGYTDEEGTPGRA